MDLNEAMEISDFISPSVKIANGIEFADFHIQPEIDFFKDEDMYFSPSEKIIHLGVLGILTQFEPKDEVSFISATNFARGHESQHVLSTATRPYSVAIQKGCEAVLEYIQEKEEGYKRRFKSEREYEDFATRELPKMKIYLSWAKIRELVAGIANSLEDGRIERIRSARMPGFANLRKTYRGIFWQHTGEIEREPFSSVSSNPGWRFTTIFNEILSLATCQLYTKGFILAYAGTDIIDEVNTYMPAIARAVMAEKTRGLINPVKEICGKLAPYIYEICKISEEDMKMRKAFDDLISSLIKKQIADMLDTGLNERDEDTGEEGDFSSVFPMSDLTITLDDETYDKLMEKGKIGSDSDGGIKVRREHPKEDENKSEEKSDSSGGGSDSDKKSDEQNSDKNGNAGNSGSDKDSDSKNSNSDKDGSSKDNNSDKDSNSGNNSSDSTDSNDSDSDSSNSEDSSNKSPSEKSAEGNNPIREDSTKNKGNGADKQKAKKHVSADVLKEVEKAVLKASREAAESANSESEKISDMVNVFRSQAKAAGVKQKDVISKAEPISPEDMKDICDFVEIDRQYKPNLALPAVLNARGKSLRRKNEMFFKSLSTPNITNLDSGSVDPGLIYGLAMGNTEIFRKKGKDHKIEQFAYLLIDNSGSMYGAKREEALKAAAVIEESISGLIDCKITAFSENGSIVHWKIKDWNERLSNGRNFSWNFCKQGPNGWGNEDGYDIQVVTREIENYAALNGRPLSKSMLVVLSDGAPGDRSLVRKAIDTARKKGIKVVGIYFEEGECRTNTTFEYMYQKDYIICPLDELDKNLEQVFRKFARS